MVDSLSTPELALWQDLGHDLAYSTLLVGPLVAASAGWRTLADRRQPANELLDSMPKPAGLRVSLLVLAAAAGPVAVYLLIGSVRGGWLALNATTGGPDFELIVSGAFALVGCSAAGVWFCSLVPSRASPAAIGLGIWVAIWLASSGGTSLSYLSPVIDGEPGPLWRYVLSLGVLQAIWFLALAGFFVSGSAMLQDRRVPVSAAFLLSALIVVATARSLMSLWPNGVESVGLAYPAVCDASGPIEVCVHEAYKHDLESTSVILNDALGPVLDTIGWPTKAVQVASYDEARLIEASNPQVLGFEGLGGEGLERQVIYQVMSFGSCDDDLRHAELREGVIVWLLRQADDGDSVTVLPGAEAWADELASWSELERREWLMNVLPLLRSCKVVPASES